MKKLLKHMKLIHLIFLILGGVVIISALPFKTQYNTVYVNVDAGGIQDASGEMTNAINQDQTLLFDYYEKIIGDDFNNHKEVVYNFQNTLNNVNTTILIFGIVIVAAALILFLFQNHKRRIYYASNVIMSVLATLGTAVFGVILLIQLLGAMGTLGANNELFNTVAVLQNSDMRTAAYQAAEAAGSAEAAKAALSQYFYVTSTTMVMYMIGIIVTIAYALFVLILTFAKFKRTKERRQEILSKAVENND